MVDRSVKMIGIEMKNNMENKFYDPILPDGYKFKTCTSDEDARGWAKIMHNVTFFETKEKAEEYFKGEFMSTEADRELASRRCFFIIDEAGKYIGTCAAWYQRVPHQGQFPKLHWLGVMGETQGLGLGKALIQKVMYTFQQENIAPVWLDTQTTSHKAIGLYLLNGFYPLTVSKSEPDKTKPPMDDFVESVEVLNGTMLLRFYEMFVKSAKAE